jgi:ADP-ribose pyrophosphatase YjhB (NUDIX family)
VLRAFWFVARPRAEGAMIAVWHAGRVLLVRNSYRRPLSMPAGNLRRGESPAAAAVRELREEVGIRVEPERLRFVREVVHRSDWKEDHSHVFEVELDEAPRLAIDGREVVWADFATRDEALARELSVPVRLYLLRASS